ncbi:MAG: ParA family protein [Candidatus Omnitrophota bacterium]|jgi:chromosome partitioning protein|nr:MAG: ParA family protein [Candidatus Omnitrophota bacterium]
MPLIMFLNLKGGVAKTTNTVAVSECFAAGGKRILMVDADHQSMAGELMLGEPRLGTAEKNRQTLHDLLSFMLNDEFQSEIIEEYITRGGSNIIDVRERLDCIPCSHRIDEFSTNMAKAKRGFQSNDEFLRRLNRVRHHFAQWCNRHYDYTLIDCPPTFVIQVLFFLGCADYFIIPSIPDRLSVRGSIYLLERLRLRGFKRIQCLGTLWTMVRRQVSTHLKIIEHEERQSGEYARMPKPFRTYIPNMSAIADAMDIWQEYPTFQAKYQYKPSHLFEQLCEEIEARIQAVR